jgi:defect-in-organelle-trafficking protein DotD
MRVFHHSAIASGLFAATLLAGCASGPVPKVAANVVTPGMPNLQTALNNAILRTDQAVDQLDGEPVMTLASARLPEALPGELEQRIRWNYEGNLGPAVHALGRLINYHVVIHHPKGVAPVLVSVHADQIPVSTVIRTLGIEAGSRATVTVIPAEQTIDVRYPRPDAVAAASGQP